jgi:putative transposase
MVTISRDSPCLSITAVAKERLPVFRTDALKTVLCRALDEARGSGGFLILAYVVMPDHLHIITDGARKSSDALRFIKGIAARRIIQHLKDGNFRASLEKLRLGARRDQQGYSLWEHESNVVLLTVEPTFMQRVNYIHQNPVRAGLVERAEEYRWSSVRYWSRWPREDEPLKVDVDKIVWRSAKEDWGKA